jgi:hypothetical protein
MDTLHLDLRGNREVTCMFKYMVVIIKDKDDILIICFIAIL